MAGAFALIMAGFGSAVVGGHVDDSTLSAGDYQTISETYTGDDVNSVDVSRDFDRKLDEQGKIQADQMLIALADQNKILKNAEAAAKKNQWVLPVTGYHLSARFGQRSGLWSRMHTGLDFAGPSGSAISSVAAGTVKSTGYEGAYGNRTIVTLIDGTDVWYCHQSRIAVSVGDKVSPGQVIGYTGSTGNVTGPHLHLEVHPGGGGPVDPYAVLVQHGIRP
ncbi:M23 family metallopeptidase [Aeromicrobium sp.]|uniref:M23 family metallopeptidase n=1 Tax=Aeromicrobium sp. TaxID=1871063 RepID=UPI002FC80341